MDVLVSTATLLVAMVFFVCEACNESLKKNKVETHRWSCRGCWVLTCVDCSKQFAGDEYMAHTSCMSEAQRYEGKLYVHKENKGDVKQQAWIDGVQQRLAASGNAQLRGYMDRLMAHDNVPRKRASSSTAKNSLNLKADRGASPSAGSSWRRPRRRLRRRHARTRARAGCRVAVVVVVVVG